MFNIALYEPEIPPNTGNIIRLCANSGSRLHLIHPLGFQLEDRYLRRAGLDYHDLARVYEYHSLDKFFAAVDGVRIIACSTRGKVRYDKVRYSPNDLLLFGPESRGLPQGLLDALPAGQIIRIPMQSASRSLNLSNAVAIILYEAWRQQDFA
ncbi:MAG: tRNA (cytidine(34)-2'-O)-methyltransferase [Gammaproteobacteria bacterium]|nr:tRNA (cytidine(34)-2'-O)-methyltransferase [Gammaproteobacteria bacterium]